MSRDSQKSKVYAAEHALRFLLDHASNGLVSAFGSTLTVPSELRFGTLEATQQYVDKVVHAEGASPVRVRARKGNNFAHYCLGEIAVPVPQRGAHLAQREIVILHEIAHHLTVGDHHGPRFTATFRRLVSAYMAPEVGFLLSCVYGEHGVRQGN